MRRPPSTDMCLLSNDIYQFNFVSQGKVDIPGVDDGEECTLTDVSTAYEAEVIPLVDIVNWPLIRLSRTV